MIVQRQKLFFQSALTGEYFTGNDLQKEAEKIRADWRNGNIKYANNGKPATKKISRANSLRGAYVNKNIHGQLKGPNEKNFEKIKNAYSKLEKNGLIKVYDKPHFTPDGVKVSYGIKKAPSKLMRKLSKLSKKFKIG